MRLLLPEKQACAAWMQLLFRWPVNVKAELISFGIEMMTKVALLERKKTK